jgi:outer membrane protein assembly factor BamB
MLDQLVFVGFNSRVAALNRDTGETVWKWKCPKGMGCTTILLDGDRLLVSVQGYTYCLDPLSGQQWWVNELPGMGTGVATLASVRGTASNSAASAVAEEEQRRQSE